MKTILVTGGAGFIGCHTVLELLEAGYDVVALDNFSNSVGGSGSDKPMSLLRVEQTTGKTVVFYSMGVHDEKAIADILKKHKVDCVFHFAAWKAVGESVTIPLEYYENNVGGSIHLLKAMRAAGVKNFVFSSSATVYGDPQRLPLDEDHPVGQGLTNPYGRSKYFVEIMLKDLQHAQPDWNIMILRYFNPVGAHPSGLIGEDPRGVPNNLMPFVAQVAVGKLPKVKVFGNDYDTPDGTGIRDYIHVVDCAKGHIAALRKMEAGPIGLKIYNLGTGTGYSVLEMISALSKACGKEIPYEIVGRREGDVPSVYCSTKRAEEELGWKAVNGLDEMCKDLWNWQSKNPNGFQNS